MNYQLISSYLFDKPSFKPISQTGITDLEKVYLAKSTLPIKDAKLDTRRDQNKVILNLG